MGIDVEAWRASIGPWHLRGPKCSRRRKRRMKQGPLSREGLQRRQAIRRTLQTAILIGILATVYLFTKVHATSGDIELNPGPSTWGWVGSSEKTSNGGLGSWMFRPVEEVVREERRQEEEERAIEEERRQQVEATQRE